jgi:hypothetical protein
MGFGATANMFIISGFHSTPHSGDNFLGMFNLEAFLSMRLPELGTIKDYSLEFLNLIRVLYEISRY